MENILTLFTKERLTKTAPYLLYAILITPAIVAGSFLFPYISMRTVYFRIITEIALFILVIILLQYKVLRVSRYYCFLYIFGWFIIINIISSLFSFSPYVSWFSDTERMWGVFTLLHLFLFYLLLRIFFKGREWKIFLNISLIISLYVAFYGFFQYYPEIFGVDVFQAGKGRIISTLGNSAYVAIYMLFNAFFALFLLMKTRIRWLKFYYIAVLLIDFYAFTLADIRGTTIGLLAGITIAFLLYILLGKSRRHKIVIASILIIGSLTLFFAFLNPESKIAKSNKLLQRITTISIYGSTTETRLIGWRAAWRGFKERPIIGVGMENYNVIFNKYFDSDYYLYAPSEPYFDRSHNAWLDVLAINGIIGFIIFLGFPFFIFYYLIKSYKKERIKLDEFLLFTALAITYFIHLVFVFDDLNSYIYFIVLIAFIEYRYNKNALFEFNEQRKIQPATQYFIGGIAVIITVVVIYTLNIKTMQAGNMTIQAMRNANNLPKAVSLFDKSLAYNGIPSRNVVLSYVNYLTGIGGSLPAIKQNPEMREVIKQGVLSALDGLEKEIKKDSYNAMLYSRKAALCNVGIIIFEDPQYISESLEASQQAIELSPEHLQYYYTLADTHIIIGNNEKAVEAIQRAVEINSRYPANYFQLARVYLADNQPEKSLKIAELFVKKKYTAPQSDFFIKLADAFIQQNKTIKAVEALKLGLKQNKSADIYIKLARLYLEQEDNEKAVKIFTELGKANENLKKDANYAVEQIKAGKGEKLLGQLKGKQ